jgi:hypothetical protein
VLAPVAPLGGAESTGPLFAWRRSAGRCGVGPARQAYKRIYWRLLPFAILTYFLCYLDRINVGFAALPLG